MTKGSICCRFKRPFSSTCRTHWQFPYIHLWLRFSDLVWPQQFCTFMLKLYWCRQTQKKPWGHHPNTCIWPGISRRQQPWIQRYGPKIFFVCNDMGCSHCSNHDSLKGGEASLAAVIARLPLKPTHCIFIKPIKSYDMLMDFGSYYLPLNTTYPVIKYPLKHNNQPICPIILKLFTFTLMFYVTKTAPKACPIRQDKAVRQ